MNDKIKSFWNKETEEIFNGFIVSGFSKEVNKQAYKRLTLLNNSPSLQAIGNIKGNKLEKKEGKLRGLNNYSKKLFTVWVNVQYRIIFTYKNGYLYDVVLLDYHK